MENKITLDRIKSIISEEIKSVIKEGEEESVQTDKIVKLSSEAGKLLKALQSFKKNVQDMKAIDATSPHIDVLLKVAVKLVKNASMYVDNPKSEPKRIVFKASKPEQDVD